MVYFRLNYSSSVRNKPTCTNLWPNSSQADEIPPSPNLANHCATVTYQTADNKKSAADQKFAADSKNFTADSKNFAGDAAAEFSGAELRNCKMPISLAEKFFPPRAVREQRANCSFAKAPTKKSDSFRAATSEKNSVLDAGVLLNKPGVENSRFHRHLHADNNNIGNNNSGNGGNNGDSEPSSMSNTVEIQI